MSGFLLDTNCISEIWKPVPEPKVVEWLLSKADEQLFLSTLTIGELRKGVELLQPGRRRAELEAWLDEELEQRFSGRILPVDVAVARRWGRLVALSRQAGRPIPVIDGLLAATALEYGLTVVTRDVNGFDGTGVALLDLWTA